MAAYYNEHDQKAAAWLRQLITACHLPAGDVDERDIRKVTGDDIRSYRQAHFFAGIGGWALALRLAGWGDDRPVWTGSCPCPPFSSAGKKKRCPQCGGKPMPHPYQTGIFACVPCGHEWHADERHLWPEFYRLIAECRPAIVFGEQVAGRDGLVWLAGVRATLEDVGYDVGAADLCAAGNGAPHIRQRLFWVADAASGGFGISGSTPRSTRHTDECGPPVGMADDQRTGRKGVAIGGIQYGEPANDGIVGRFGDTELHGRFTVGKLRESQEKRRMLESERPSGGVGSECGGAFDGDGGIESGRASAVGFWDRYNVVHCGDGKARRFEPESFPLADGLPGRVAALRGYGNAIVPQVAAQFIQAYREARGV